MIRARNLSAAAAVVAALAASNAGAVVTTYNWKPGLTGPQNWQVDGNWHIANFPNLNTDVANLSVGLGSGLTLNVGATDVTVAGLALGGTSGAVTTNVTGGLGGRLVFQNSDVATPEMPPDPAIPAFNNGNALITSAGVAGSTNLISAPVFINNESLDFDNLSTNNVTISGPVSFSNGAIRSFMPTGMKATISGPITLVDAADGVTAQSLSINNSNAATIGTIEFSGPISGAGGLNIGATNSGGGLGTVILSGNNTYSGRTTANRGNLVLASDSAFGVDMTIGDPATGGANYQQGNPSNVLVYNFLSDNDSRKISVDMQMAQWQSVKGDHSLEWAGSIIQTNSRGWVNLLPDGKTLTLSGPQYGHREAETSQRIYTFDGTGKTIVSGGFHDQFNANVMSGVLQKRGTGTLIVNGSTLPTPNLSDYTGATFMDSGTLHFAKDGDFASSGFIVSTGGAMGVDDPASPTFSNSTLLGKLDSFDNGGLMLTAGESSAALDFTGALSNVPNMSVAAPETATSASPFNYTGTITPAPDAVTSVPTYRLGGGSDAGKNVLRLPNEQLTGASNLEVSNGGEVVLAGPNTYSGTTAIRAKYNTSNTTPAINNATAGSTGSTVFQGTTLSVSNLTSGATSSIGSASDAASNLLIQGSTLKYIGGASSTNRLFTVGTGGATIEASGTGPLTFNSTSALDMDVAEDRMASYEDQGSNGFPDGQFGTINPHTRLQIEKTDDLVVGMGIVNVNITLVNQNDMVSTTPFPQPTAVTGIIPALSNPTFSYPSSISFGPAVPNGTTPYKGSGTIQFVGVARTVTLGGTNTGDNTFKPLIANAAATTAGSVNTVNLAKNGTGKWILSGNNTYTGTTAVNAGTLLVNGAHSGTGAVTVAAGATLGGTGSLAAAVTNNGTISPGASVGTLTLGAGLTMATDSTWTAELLGSTADLLAITGNLDLSALGNTLNVVDLGKTGTSWLLATVTGSINGAFESITSGYSVDYGVMTPGQLRLNFSGGGGVQGDYNGNGTVDAADYVLWRKGGLLLNDPTPGVQPADYDFWKSRFGATSGSGSGSAIGSTTVPEPTSAMLAIFAVLGTLGLFGRGRRSVSSR